MTQSADPSSLVAASPLSALTGSSSSSSSSSSDTSSSSSGDATGSHAEGFGNALSSDSSAAPSLAELATNVEACEAQFVEMQQHASKSAAQAAADLGAAMAAQAQLHTAIGKLTQAATALDASGASAYGSSNASKA